MDHAFDLTAAWWTFIVRGSLTYIGLLVLMRIAGKRSFGEMSAFDVVIIALAGGTLRTAIIGDDPTMTGPFLGVTGILGTHKLIAWVSTRFPGFNRWVEGFPAIVIKDGKRVESALHRQNIPDAALDRVLHAHGMEDERDVVVGRLEPNGKITLVRRRGQNG